MSGNTFGRLFCLTSFGESHGPAIGGVVDGCPPGLALSEADLQKELDRRRPGSSRFTSQRQEPDQVKILSGIFEGKTTGTPIGFIIENVDKKSHHYDDTKDLFRPGHAEYTYWKKYGIYDYRGGGRSSARETAVRVAAGAIAKKYLYECCGLLIRGYVAQIGDIQFEQFDWDAVNSNPFFFPDINKINKLEELITRLREEGNSTGARVNVVGSEIPPGLGEPVYEKLDSDIAAAMMSINAVKAVEIGAGFESVAQTGSQHRDEITPDGFLSNNAGGILGGISTGQDILVSLALKPTSSIRIPGRTIDIHGKPAEIVTTGRHDPCVGIRAVPIAEAMLALVLMDHYLRQRAQNSK